MNVQIINADEVRSRITLASEEKVNKFNDLVNTALLKCSSAPSDFSMRLPFDSFGYNYSDVAFAVKAGYRVAKNPVCLWWDVTLPRV